MMNGRCPRVALNQPAARSHQIQTDSVLCPCPVMICWRTLDISFCVWVQLQSHIDPGLVALFVFLFLTVSLKGVNQWVLLHVHQLIHCAVFVLLLYEQWQSQLFTELPGDKTDSYFFFFSHCCSCAMCIKKPITVEPYLLGLIKFMCTVAMVTQWQLNLLKWQLKPPVWRLDELCALFTTEWLIFSQMW